MINRVVLVGRLTKDPELRKTQSGTSVVSFSLAVNRRVQTPGQPDADFINCVAWNRLADLMCQYLHRGSLIGVEGRIQTRNYENNQGQRVYVTEVVADNVQFLEPKNTQHAQSNTYGANRLPWIHMDKWHLLCRLHKIHLVPILTQMIHWIFPVMIYHSNRKEMSYGF